MAQLAQADVDSLGKWSSRHSGNRLGLDARHTLAAVRPNHVTRASRKVAGSQMGRPGSDLRIPSSPCTEKRSFHSKPLAQSLSEVKSNVSKGSSKRLLLRTLCDAARGARYRGLGWADAGGRAFDSVCASISTARLFRLFFNAPSVSRRSECTRDFRCAVSYNAAERAHAQVPTVGTRRRPGRARRGPEPAALCGPALMRIRT